MQRLLECPICINYFDTQDRIPKTLMCGHGFCLLCLKDLVTGPGLKCPTCRKVCQLPEGKVEQFPTSYASLDLLDTSCEECRDQSWTQRCHHCSRNLCDKCQVSHLRGSPFDLWTELTDLKEAVASLKKQSVDDSILKQISGQGENTIANINHTYQEWIEELQRQNKRHVSTVKDQMQSDNERVLAWSGSLFKLLSEVNTFIDQVQSEVSTSASSGTVDQTAAKDQCTQRIALLKAAQESRPMQTCITFRASQVSFDLLLTKCAELVTPKSADTLGSQGMSGTLPEYTLASYKQMWSKQDSSRDDFWWPWGIAISPLTQNIVVTDYISHMTQVHTRNFNLAYKLAQTSSTSSRPIQPFGVAINKSNEILLSDQNNHCVHVTDEWGNFQTTFGRYGNGPGEFDKPNGLACGPDGLLYVCDGGNLRVQVLRSDGSLASVLEHNADTGSPLFPSAPFFIAISAHGIVAVSDYSGSIHIMTTKGKLMRKIEAKQPPHNLDANGLAFDQQGNIIVADQSGALVIMQNDGQYICSVGGPGRRAGQLMDPRGVVVTEHGDIAVCDMANQRIQLFEVPNM